MDDGQDEINLFLSSLGPNDRDTLARMLAHEFVAGVHTVLTVLHEAHVEPFNDGFEGTPFHDFVGRLAGWEWPS